MANTLLLKRSAVAGRAPVLADLVLGELAVNVTDGKLYLKKSTSGVESIVDVTAGGMTDAELFAKVTAQDGAGSGLDADLLDGAHASAFAQLAGATFTGTVTAPNFVSSSDARLKSDIAPIPDALAKVQALTGVTFTMAGSDVRQMGLIAQEVPRDLANVFQLDRGDQRRSGDAPGLALIPMPALRVEAQGAHHAALGQAPGAEVGVGKRACDRHGGRKQTRRRRGPATGGFGLPRHWRIGENRLRTAKMCSGLGQKIGKAGDPRAFADDVEEIAEFRRG